MKHVPEDPSLKANCRKACCVSFMINFVIIIIIIGIQPLGRSGQRPELSQATEFCQCRKKQKLSLYLGSLFRTLGATWVSEQLRFFLHDSGGYLCIFPQLLISPSFFLMFHTS